MKKQSFTFSKKHYCFIMGMIGLFLVLYLAWTVRSLIALMSYQRFVRVSVEQPQRASKALEAAIRFDGNNPRYYYELGGGVHRSYANLSSYDGQQRKSGFQNAEASLKRAVMLNPGESWYYYELARLNLLGDGESDASICSSFDNFEKCSPAKYFLAALQRASYNMFLRRTVGAWFYEVDPEKAFDILRPIISERSRGTEHSQHMLREEYAKFLYDIQKDSLSEQTFGREKDRKNICQTTPLRKQNDLESVEIELGHDDGRHDWRTHLTSEVERIKKHICLPADLSEYDYAALKIFMKHAGSADFISRVYLDEHLVKEYNRDIPPTGTWHEIPFNISLLQGKSDIHVYIRVAEASNSPKNNHLLVFGDRDMLNVQSMRNFQEIDDLSTEEGPQTGEYMIRLLLKASLERGADNI